MAQPIALPGYWYDSEKRRYFKGSPPSELAAASSSSSSTNAASAQGQPRKRRKLSPNTPRHSRIVEKRPYSLLNINNAVGPSWPGQPSDLRRRVLHSLYPTLSHLCSREPCPASPIPLTAFTPVPEGERLRLRCGNSAGFVYDYVPAEESELELGSGSGVGRVVERYYDPTDPFTDGRWESTAALGSEISSAVAGEKYTLLTSLGPKAQVAIISNRLDEPQLQLTYSKTNIWSSALDDGDERTNLFAGCDNNVWWLSDLNMSTVRYLDTSSAVFALLSRRSELYAGTRKGRIHMYDLRSARTSHRPRPSMPGHLGKGHDDDGGSSTVLSMSSAITHLRAVNEWILLGAAMDGTMSMFDLRYLNRTYHRPIKSLEGQVNSYSRTLGLDTWDGRLLAAAGQDGRIRIWSLLEPSPTTPIAHRVNQSKGSGNADIGDSLSSHSTSEHVKALHFVRGYRQGALPDLWVANGSDLEKYAIG